MFCLKKKKFAVAKVTTGAETLAISWRAIEDTPPAWNDYKLPNNADRMDSKEQHADNEVASSKPVPTETAETSTQVEPPRKHTPPDIEIHPVDSNDNIIGGPNTEDSKANEAKTSDASSLNVWTRTSSASLLSSSSGPITRREPLRARDEGDDLSIELITYEKNEKEIHAIRKALRADEFFTTIADDAVEQLIAYMSPKVVKNNEVIIKLGDKNGDCMYVSKAGKYRVTTRDLQTIDFQNCRLFGEVAILCDTPRTATVAALTDGSLWKLKRHVFKRVVTRFKMEEADELLKFLRNVPGINEASDLKLRRIADFCKPRTYGKDSPIVHEGQKGNDFFIIKSGTAVVNKIGVGRLKTLKRGDFFGEKALLTEDKRTASISAGPNGVVCLILSRGEFNENLGDLRVFLEESDEKSAGDEPQVPKANSHKDQYKSIELKDLKHIKLLGKGAFGVVDLVQSPKNEKFALKSIERRRLVESNNEKSALNERDIQRACESIFIVELYATLKDERKLYFLLEYCPRGELCVVLRKKRKFSEVITKFVAACILEALAYLHRRHYVFLDLKPENIIIDMDGYPKLTDFGCAQQLKRGEKTYMMMGTPEYLAPEIVKHSGYDKGADYWAFGVLIYEMLFGVTPFVSKADQFDYKKLVHCITKGLTTKHLQRFEKPAVRDLVRKLIEINPNKRLGCLRNGVTDVFQHDWFKDMDFEQLNQKRLRSPMLALFKK